MRILTAITLLFFLISPSVSLADNPGGSSSQQEENFVQPDSHELEANSNLKLPKGHGISSADVVAREVLSKGLSYFMWAACGIFSMKYIFLPLYRLLPDGAAAVRRSVGSGGGKSGDTKKRSFSVGHQPSGGGGFSAAVMPSKRWDKITGLVLPPESTTGEALAQAVKAASGMTLRSHQNTQQAAEKEKAALAAKAKELEGKIEQFIKKQMAKGALAIGNQLVGNPELLTAVSASALTALRRFLVENPSKAGAKILEKI